MRALWAGVAAALIAAAGGAQAADFDYPQSGPLTSNYYSSRPSGYHGALDIAGANLSPIGAARAGRVSFRGWNGGYGNLVVIDHGDGYQTYYAHLSRFAVSVGQGVSAGQTIGYEGSTGNSTGPHVHFEVRRYGTKHYLPGRVGDRVTKGAGVPYDFPGIGGQGSSQAPPSSGGGGPSSGLSGERVTASALNVRTGPSTAYGVMGLVRSGQVYVSTGSSGGWHKVWFDGRQGWCSGSYLARSGGEGREVTASALNVRSGPSTGSGVVGLAPNGSVYARAGASGDWIQIWFGGAARWFYAPYTRARGL
jgi:uncharacterized protein YraI